MKAVLIFSQFLLVNTDQKFKKGKGKNQLWSHFYWGMDIYFSDLITCISLWCCFQGGFYFTVKDLKMLLIL